MTSQIERVVLITGAASGVGAATVRALAGPGTAMLLHTRRNEAGLQTVAEAAQAAGTEVATELADLAEADASAVLVATTLDRFGRLDQIVSNAGYADKRGFGDVDAAALRASLASITEAFFGLVTAALPQLEASSWGRVVAVSSFVAHSIGVNDTIFPVSAAAKSGLEGLAKTLAFQLARTGTTVNCVSPGFTQKDPGAHAAVSGDGWQRAADAAPMKTLVTPADVAAAIAFFLSREADRITGQVLHVDAGLDLL
ncbi:MAG: SDR family oxidoreductase [Alphaproteobacteria bacterium]|nr:SDR family oxidoreductase [Alphaproteobacteria bacterium]